MIRLVFYNLNTHRKASLYETFPAPEAHRIAKRPEFHHTAKPGIWLNPVLSLSKGWRRSSSACWPGPACADATATRTAWKAPPTPACQNATLRAATIDWSFTAKDARTKLHRLYPCHS